jgi:tRNA (mo5U34)-methyltransferase
VRRRHPRGTEEHPAWPDPWRKGPFDLFGVHVDTEWRSDWKWSRVSPHLDLVGKRVLDVGCGNGYYQWRMLGAGADSVIGVDPNWLFFCQFQAMKRYLPQRPAWHLPLTLEELPANLEGFDTVFSMGVFYHRRSPIEHLFALKDCLVVAANWCWKPWWSKATRPPCWSGRSLCADAQRLVPALGAGPGTLAAPCRFQRCALRGPEPDHGGGTALDPVDALPVATDFLDPHDHNRTIEGLPAPLRATLVARKP